MKKVNVFLLFFLTTVQIKSQVPQSFQVRLFAHIVRTSAGTGGATDQELNTALSNLERDFMPHGISFCLSGKDYIDNDGYYGGLDPDPLFSSPNQPTNAINLYILPSFGFRDSKASGLPGTALYVGGTFTNNPTDVSFTSVVLSHELGHCLGLFHTFEDSACIEFVNGSNSATCGDLVTDTPASPAIYSHQTSNDGVTCFWSLQGTVFDPNGDAYVPMVNNIMDYSFSCPNHSFTAGQGLRMRQTLANSSVLQSVIGTCSTAEIEESAKIDGIDLAINPNPFSTSMSIKYVIPTGTQADIFILDAFGRKIATLNALKEHFEIEWDTSSVPSGVYLVVLNTAQGNTIRRVIKN
jgi:hypothetical protein